MVAIKTGGSRCADAGRVQPTGGAQGSVARARGLASRAQRAVVRVGSKACGRACTGVGAS
jgi:hypothetical protein